jgi:hypothetical protein
MSLYDYAGGDPVNGLDPDGRCVEGTVAGFTGAPQPGNSPAGNSPASPPQPSSAPSSAYASVVANGLYVGSAVANIAFNVSPTSFVGTSQNPTAYGLGLEWAAGTATNQTFTDGQTMTTQLQQTQYVSTGVANLENQLASSNGGNLSTVDFSRYAGSEPEVPYVLGYLNDVLGMGISPDSNPTRGFLGSFAGSATPYLSVVDPNTDQGLAFTSFQAYNVSSLVSGFRASPSQGGYTQNATLIPVSNNMFGASGPYHTVSQTFQWNEAVPFQVPFNQQTYTVPVGNTTIQIAPTAGQ